MLAGVSAQAADLKLPVKAPQPLLDWSGFYVGGHWGYARGTANVTVIDPVVADTGKALGSQFGGLQVGYNHFLTSGLMLGVEGDLTFPSFLSSDDVAKHAARRS